MWADAVSEAATLWYFAAVTAQETHASLNLAVWNSPRDFRILHLRPEYLEKPPHACPRRNASSTR